MGVNGPTNVEELIKAALYGLVEGITEWLPISSTGHLLLLDQFVKLNVSADFWDMFLVVIQLGAILAVIGVFMTMLAKKEQNKSIGNIMVGFAVLMIGMDFMSDAVAPLADMPQFGELLVRFRNPVVGVVVGALFTALIQSSAASVGILQALAMTGSITYGMAIPIIMGQNIGTCITSI
ncbi:MAG: Na/Pi symporter, partial [Coriobacteriales bacterium]|nr:Na/Pi symporter [Coriobacteriales bacterium]